MATSIASRSYTASRIRARWKANADLRALEAHTRQYREHNDTREGKREGEPARAK
jgi:hypothetical protein